VKGVYVPGSELRVRFRRPDHPIAYGYGERTSVFREDRTLYAVRHSEEGRIVLQWGTELPKDDAETAGEARDDKDKKEEKEPLVVSGGEKGADEIAGKPAILDRRAGAGGGLRLFIHRYQTLSDFRWSGFDLELERLTGTPKSLTPFVGCTSLAFVPESRPIHEPVAHAVFRRGNHVHRPAARGRLSAFHPDLLVTSNSDVRRRVRVLRSTVRRS
jgi:hypothetical protein